MGGTSKEAGAKQIDFKGENTTVMVITPIIVEEKDEASVNKAET